MAQTSLPYCTESKENQRTTGVVEAVFRLYDKVAVPRITRESRFSIRSFVRGEGYNT